MTLPLETGLPPIFGRSVVFLVFAALGAFVLVLHPRRLLALARHRLVLGAFVFLLLSLLIESLHERPDHSFAVRTAIMFGNGAVIAALVRSRDTVDAVCLGVVGAGAAISVLVVLQVYSLLSALSASSFVEADLVRLRVFESTDFRDNLNLHAQLAGLAALLALIRARSTGGLGRTLWLTLAATCLLGAVLPMSRSALGLVVVTGVVVLRTYGLSGRNLVATAVLGLGLAIATPEVVWTRVVGSPTEIIQADSRARIVGTLVENWRDYWALGVGSGNYEHFWARQVGLEFSGGVAGTHITFAEVTVYWGILALLALLVVLRMSYKMLPRVRPEDPQSMSVVVMSIFLFGMLFVTDNLYMKILSLGFGLLLGYRVWVPQGVQGRGPRFGVRGDPEATSALPALETAGASQGSHLSRPD